MGYYWKAEAPQTKSSLPHIHNRVVWCMQASQVLDMYMWGDIYIYLCFIHIHTYIRVECMCVMAWGIVMGPFGA